MYSSLKISRAVSAALWSGVALAALAGCKQPDETAGGANTTAAVNTTSAANATAPTASDVGKAPPYQGANLLIGEYGSMDGPEADFGIHLALTSEHPRRRWTGVLGPRTTPSLHDADGFLPTNLVTQRGTPDCSR